MEEKADLSVPPEAQTSPGPTQSTGWVSAGLGGATSFIDHNCLSGSWLPLRLPDLPLPGSSICLSTSPWRPISATLSSTQPDSMPRKLRGHDTAMCRQLKMQLRHTECHGSVGTGPHFHGPVVTGDPSALTVQRCIDFVGSLASPAGRGGQHTQISSEPHGQGPSPADNQRLPMDTSRALRPKVPTRTAGHSSRW